MPEALLDDLRVNARLEREAGVGVPQVVQSDLRQPAAPDCQAIPIDPVTGAHGRPGVKRWCCEKHRHRAAPGDMEPRRSSLRYSPTGAIENVDESEAEGERVRAEAESRRRRHEARLAERRADAERLQPFEDAKREQPRQESITTELRP